MDPRKAKALNQIESGGCSTRGLASEQQSPETFCLQVADLGRASIGMQRSIFSYLLEVRHVFPPRVSLGLPATMHPCSHPRQQSPCSCAIPPVYLPSLGSGFLLPLHLLPQSRTLQEQQKSGSWKSSQTLPNVNHFTAVV